MDNRAIIGILVLGLIIACALSISFVGLILKAICWASSLTFTWKLAIGVWIGLLL